MSTARKILVAPAWPYAAGHRHLGHVAGFGVPSDAFARYHRLKGNDVLMVSGTDEHGTPVMVAADREGKSYAEVADYYNAAFRDDFRRLGLSYDCFSRTTTRNHAAVTQDIFKTLYEHGAIVEREMLVSFSPTTGHTLPDRYIEGTCPICGYPEARGDQCDNCGNQLDPTELINPRSKIDGATPEFRETKHLFLDLPRFADALRAWINRHDDWRPNVRKFSLGLIDEIRPRPITRDLDWGVTIPVPGYAEDANKRIYVWFDAVIGYLSASIEWAAASGDPDAWRDWWQNPEARHAYFQGKDNIVFHTVIWPAMLLGYAKGGEYGAGQAPLELPDNVFATEYLTMEGKQFSSSRQHVIYLRDFSTATTRIRCGTTSSPPGRRRRTPTSPGPSSCAATTTSYSRTGATSSTARSRTPIATSARCPSQAHSPPRTRPSSTASTAASRRWAPRSRRVAFVRRSAR